MKRTLILLVIFLALGGVAAWYLMNPEDEKTSLLAYERDFAVENTDRIYKIFLADRQGTTTTLERKDGYWLYDGRYKVRPNAMDNLLDAICRIQMKYKPPLAAVDGMIKSLSTEGIKVELYDRQGKMIKTYYVGGSTADERGTYAIMDGVEQPYVVHIPSWEGNLRFRFNLRGEDWRDKTVLAYEPEDIQAVSIEYPLQKNKSFRLERDGKGFKVSPFYDVTPRINRPIREGAAEAFLTGFESQVAEAFENNNPGRDSITQLIPFSIITVTDAKGEEKEVRLFPIYPEQEIDLKTGAVIGSGDVERYFADCSCGDFFLVQHLLFRKILWAYEFFFEKES